MWKQTRDCVILKPSSKFRSKGHHELHIDPAITDENLRLMIEDALFNNVGTGRDAYKDHPDNAFSLEDLSGMARGRKRRGGEFVQVPCVPENAPMHIEEFVNKYKHVAGLEVPFPKWEVPEN